MQCRSWKLSSTRVIASLVSCGSSSNDVCPAKRLSNEGRFLLHKFRIERLLKNIYVGRLRIGNEALQKYVMLSPGLKFELTQSKKHSKRIGGSFKIRKP